MSQFINSIKEVKKNYTKYDKWEQNQADDVAKRRYLSEQLNLPKDKVELTREKAKAVFRASDLMDKRSEDNCANMEQTTGLVGMGILLPITAAIMYYPAHLSKQKKSMNTKQSLIYNLATIIAVMIPSIGLALWGTSKQKEASRIGRYQAKQHELKDVKNFVMYTPEQITAAEKIAKNLPDKKENKSITKLLDDMKQMSIDKQKYKESLKNKPDNNVEIQKLLNKEYSPKQLANAEEDKEIVVNIVKDVNMTAENYSENVENAFDTIGLMSLITDIPIYFGVKKLLEKAKNVSAATKQFAPWLTASAFTLYMLFWGTKEKKEASRVGRYSKRKEILDNPELIMAYSDKQLEQAKNIKGEKIKKGFFEKIGNNIKFLNKYLKEKPGYEKYKKTTAKENEKLYEALLKTETSKKQLQDAKNLRDKTFRTFDKVDEMSQRYSEDTEAATEIAKQVTSTTFSFIGIFTPIVLSLAIVKGKFPLKSVLKSISNITLKKTSSLRNFIEKANKLIDSDKELKKDFPKIIGDKKIREKFKNHPKLQELLLELTLNNQKHFEKLKNVKKPDDLKEFKELSKDFINENFKQDPFSKWVRNLSIDISRLKIKSKLKKEANAQKTPKEIKNKNSDTISFEIPFKKIKEFYNNYKTFSNTILFGGFAPIIALGVGIPFAISSWLTNIQLKAGRIGIMKAMDEVDNAKLFVDNN